MGLGFLLGGDESVLELDHGNEYTSLNILKCCFVYFRGVSFIVYALYLILWGNQAYSCPEASSEYIL